MSRTCQDLGGRVFGLLTVIGRVSPGTVEGRHAVWLCRCDCGGARRARTGALERGIALSCGCVADLRRSATRSSSFEREKGVWRNMIQRCHNPARPEFRWYGARGIKVCDRWRSSFSAFFADMGPIPTGLSIDRINNDGNYEPGNCRWATRGEQARNTSRTRRLAFRGESLILTDWAARFGMSPHSLCKRVKRRPFPAVAADLADGVPVESAPLWETVDGQTFIYL